MIELLSTIVLTIILLPVIVWLCITVWSIAGFILSSLIDFIEDIVNIPRDIIMYLYKWATSKPINNDRKKLGYK